MRIRSENRLIRPFLEDSQVRDSLKGSYFELNNSRVTGSVVIPDGSFASYSLNLVFSDEIEKLPAKVKNAGFDPDQVSLFLIATGKTFKVSEVVLACKVSELPFSNNYKYEIPVDEKPLIFHDFNSGVEIVLALALNQQLQEIPLAPFAAGTWLSRIDLSIVSEKVFSSFSLKPMPDEYKKLFGASCQIYLKTGEPIYATNSMDDALEFYVDSEILGFVQNSPSSVVSKGLFALWARAGLSSLVNHASKCAVSEEVSAEDLANGDHLAQRLISTAQKGTERTKLQLATMLINSPEDFVALLDGQSETKKLIRNLIGD